MAKTPKTARTPTSQKSRKTVEAIRHATAKRKNIPTAEYGALTTKELQKPIALRYPRNPDLDPQLVWRGKDQQDWSDLVVNAPPLYIQEKIHPKVLIDDLARETGQREHQAGEKPIDLFADFNGLPHGVDRTEFYQHDQNWTNRIILGDSLQVMASLAEREGLRGKVQCIYFDPPYGIKFNSNFQWSTTSRDVKDGNAAHITREPEQVKAFRDTWRDGLHTYLTYLRDRLSIARDLLTDSGSIFVQIGDENVHLVRSVLDEALGRQNFCGAIAFTKTSAVSSPMARTNVIGDLFDYVLWYCRNFASVKFRQPYRAKIASDSSEYRRVELPTGARRTATLEEVASVATAAPVRARFYRQDNIISTGFSESLSKPFEAFGNTFVTGTASHWKTTRAGMQRLLKAGRLEPRGSQLAYVRFVDDFPVSPIGNYWDDVIFSSRSEDKVYVVPNSRSRGSRSGWTSAGVHEPSA